jgi:hypothetical protein
LVCGKLSSAAAAEWWWEVVGKGRESKRQEGWGLLMRNVRQIWGTRMAHAWHSSQTSSLTCAAWSRLLQPIEANMTLIFSEAELDELIAKVGSTSFGLVALMAIGRLWACDITVT